MLYGRQPRWSAVPNAAGATDQFVGYAKELGLDSGRFAECLRSDRYAEDVTKSLKLGESLGVGGTPTLFINGERLSETPSFSQLERIVREKAEEQCARRDDRGRIGRTVSTATSAPPRRRSSRPRGRPSPAW